ncbi:MAG: putative RNase H-like HicB family nuclease [Verrucomicrobiales bacterium]|jgi:predicted RNase H-like HicB family nuclease
MSDEVEALLHPSDDEKFWAEIVGLNGCYAQGDNYSQIMANLRDAHELCSTVPNLPPPPPTEIALGDETTVASLITVLAPHGWSESGESSASNQLLAHTGSGARLCVPLDSGETLNSGFRAAVTTYLRGA